MPVFKDHPNVNDKENQGYREAGGFCDSVGEHNADHYRKDDKRSKRTGAGKNKKKAAKNFHKADKRHKPAYCHKRLKCFRQLFRQVIRGRHIIKKLV